MRLFNLIFLILIGTTGFGQINEIYSGTWTNEHDKDADYVFVIKFDETDTQSLTGTLQRTQKQSNATMGILRIEGGLSDDGQVEIDVYDRFENEMTRASLTIDEGSEFLIFKQLQGYLVPMLPEEIQLTKKQSN